MVSSLPGRGLRVAVAGLGNIGKVHVDSARRSGAEIVGVSGGNLDRTTASAAELGIQRVFTTSEELAASPDVDVMHICTPNVLHAPLAKLALQNGKHVICEKPLATSVQDAQEITDLARQNNLVASLPFVYRFHPVVRDARWRVKAGETGPIRLIHGSYLQDWLATADDYNWRVDPRSGGESQAFADIGSHWCDLIEFVSGHRIVKLIANMRTTVPQRRATEAPPFTGGNVEGELVDAHGEDAVTMMFMTDQGAAGNVTISQVSHGRKNRLWFEIDATNEALWFDQERPEELWLGQRSAQHLVLRDPTVLSPAAARYAQLPVGHAQGYDDAFYNFVSDTYKAITGEIPEGLPVFADGVRAAQITAAVLESSKDGSWKEV